MHAKLLQSCPTLANPMDWLLCPRDSPSKNTGVGCYAFLQQIFPIQGLNPSLFTSPALAGGILNTSAIWEAQKNSL